MNTQRHLNQSNHFQPKHPNLPETTLAEITNSNLTQQNPTHPRHMHSRSKTSTNHLFSPEGTSNAQSQGENTYEIVEMGGKTYEIEYGSVERFQKSFQKLLRETEISYGLALKVVILARVVKKNNELENILETVLEQYGKNKFCRIQHTIFI